MLVTINGDANLHRTVLAATFSCLMQFISFNKQKMFKTDKYILMQRYKYIYIQYSKIKNTAKSTIDFMLISFGIENILACQFLGGNFRQKMIRLKEAPVFLHIFIVCITQKLNRIFYRM